MLAGWPGVARGKRKVYGENNHAYCTHFRITEEFL